MAVLVSVASGKGGVGKSVAVCNLGLVLARLGRRVVLADLDVGGANLHLLLGCVRPERTLSDFLQRRVQAVAEVLHPVSYCRNLQFLPGTGDSLETANLRHATKLRLLREIARLDADVVLIDVGAGTSYNALDFFLAADRQIAVATPEPAAVLDVYTFVKLAAARRLQALFGRTAAVSGTVARQDFPSLAEVVRAAGAVDSSAGAAAARVLSGFAPLLLLNRVGPGARLNAARLNSTLRRYVGSEVTLLGEIPEDDAVARSVRAFLPVVEHAPESAAGRAFLAAARRLVPALSPEAGVAEDRDGPPRGAPYGSWPVAVRHASRSE